MTETTSTPQDHCQQCGSTDPEDVMARSYSGCCNERVVWGGCDDDCNHTDKR